MSLPPLAGHEERRERIRLAASTGRFPQSLLLQGPAGVGKQRLALWTGSLLLCAEEPAAAPCGRCRSCRLAERLEHPDLHWHFPIARPRGAAHKLREKLEEARLAELARRRENPLEPVPEEGPAGIYLAAVEEVRAQAARRPAMGRRSVFVMGDAEAMVPQAASPEAANAFLKLLEEPPPHVFVILTSSRPGALLPTIRSRSLSLRVPPLRTEEVERFLVAEAGLPEEEAARAARLSQGSIGRALRIATGREAGERELAAAMLGAALSGRQVDALRAAAGLASYGARGEFSSALRALNEMLRDALSASVDRAELAFDPELARRLVPSEGPAPDALLDAMDRVEEARSQAAGNLNPQAIASVLLLDLNRTLRRR